MESYEDNAPGVARFSVNIMDFQGVFLPVVFKAPETEENLKLACQWIKDSEKSFRGMAISIRIAALNPSFHWRLTKAITQSYRIQFSQMNAPAGSAQIPNPPRPPYESGRE